MGVKYWIANLARNVKKRRNELGITQKQLIERSGLSDATVEKIEQGRIKNPTLETLEVLEKGLKLKDGSDLLR